MPSITASFGKESESLRKAIIAAPKVVARLTASTLNGVAFAARQDSVNKTIPGTMFVTVPSFVRKNVIFTRVRQSVPSQMFAQYGTIDEGLAKQEEGFIDTTQVPTLATRVAGRGKRKVRKAALLENLAITRVRGKGRAAFARFFRAQKAQGQNNAIQLGDNNLLNATPGVYRFRNKKRQSGRIPQIDLLYYEPGKNPSGRNRRPRKWMELANKRLTQRVYDTAFKKALARLEKK